MEIVIVTGLSGAGKTHVIREIEDLGYFCIDNMPPQFIQKFVEVCMYTNGNVSNVAFVIDIRGREFFNYIGDVISWFRDNFINYRVLFLDCSNEILVRRFKETRRLHPLSYEGKILNGILKERTKLEFFKDNADIVIDTSNLKVQELKYQVRRFMLDDYNFGEFVIEVISFGYKYGIPMECDLTFDVRFLENPFYIKSLKKLSGLDNQVKEFIMKKQESKIFLDKIYDLIYFLLPNYLKEGRKRLVVGIGCTGGQHRSVVISEEFLKKLNKCGRYKLFIEHRDLERNMS